MTRFLIPNLAGGQPAHDDILHRDTLHDDILHDDILHTHAAAFAEGTPTR